MNDSGTSKSDASKSDISNPYFSHHSDHLGLVLISKPLNGDNYSVWRRVMTLALNAKDKLGFFNGTIKAPSKELILMTMQLGHGAMIWCIPGSLTLSILNFRLCNLLYNCS